ncbi:HWE histidine kinase domain-containing protein [Pseudoroseomonas cervicalis]|uniref:HWE histidine kinase domain-containing protein n=1 Tax=Teichococcus cervicalis TaxID=204525 RepID=UPI00277E2CCC|nr:HWE histidine kinase domain-containing protein [Pseudoroseomonas cervicalis]MDQ1081830.1 PAS domain S-box-containing protein [Pseudoroseomonas cervicalis]
MRRFRSAGAAWRQLPAAERFRLAAVLAGTAAPGVLAALLLGLQLRGTAFLPLWLAQALPLLLAALAGLAALAVGLLLAAALRVRPLPSPPAGALATPRAAPAAIEPAPPPPDANRAEAMRGLVDEVSAAQAALDQLRRAAEMLDGLDDGVLALDAAGTIRFANDPALALCGRSAAQVVGQALGAVFPGLGDAAVLRAVARVAQGGEAQRLDDPVTLSGRSLLLGLSPLPGGVTLRLRDLTPLREAEEKLKTAEEKLRVALEGSGMAGWDMDLADGRMRWSPRLFQLLGLPRREGGFGLFEEWLALVDPKDAPALQQAWRGAHRGGVFRNTHRIRRPDGDTRWLEAYGAMAGGGATGRFLGVVLDVTARQRAEEQRALLTREIDHRAKNVLSTIQAIIRLTSRSDPERFATAIEGRIGALARAHSLLAREGWSAVALRDLVWSEMTVRGREAAIDLSGPPVLIVPVAVQPLAVALHELAVNALAHGALSRPGGTLTVQWSAHPEGGLALLWTESGGPPLAAPPERKGFGRRVIDSAINDQLEGSIAYQWRREGLACRIRLPQSRFEAQWQALDTPRLPPPMLQPEAEAPALGEAPLQGARIFLVEDEPMIGEALATMLRQWGCQPLGPARSIDEALRRLVEMSGAIDLALVDVNLNGQESFPVAELLAARGVPVIYLTGYAELPGTRLGHAAAMLRKPVSGEQLKTALRRILALQPQRG